MRNCFASPLAVQRPSLCVIPAQAAVQQVSFLRKQEPSTPLPTAGEAGLAGGNAEGRAG